MADPISQQTLSPMKDLNKKGQQFYRQWEERRKNKWLWVFINGSVYWGLPIAIVTVFSRSNFHIENMKLSELAISVIIFGIGGMGYGLSQFKRIDNMYLALNDDDEIEKGIQTLKAGGIWNYENLKISKKDDEMLIIQNELFWFEEKEISTENINECLNLIRSDFSRLQKNKEFKDYFGTRKAMIQLFDNTGSNTPLVEKVI